MRCSRLSASDSRQARHSSCWTTSTRFSRLPLISRMLAATGGLKILATSQAALELRGEHEFVLSPLALPAEQAGSPGSVGVAPAVELFVERARATRPDFELTEENAATVAQICRRLDGLPLAIELAASLVKLLSPEAILRRLDARFELLTGGARDVPERHRTLRSAIDWSYEQLEQDEQRLFVRLGVFVGGSTFESIAAVCDDPEAVRPGELFELLGALVDKSLVLQRPGPDGEPRFATLESVRLYALERVAEGQLDELRDRHAGHFLGLVEAAEPELTRAGQSVWREQLIDQAGNVRAALGWLLQSHQADAAARMATALTRFWSVRGLTERRARMGQVGARTRRARARAPSQVPVRSRVPRPRRRPRRCQGALRRVAGAGPFRPGHAPRGGGALADRMDPQRGGGSRRIGRGRRRRGGRPEKPGPRTGDRRRSDRLRGAQRPRPGRLARGDQSRARALYEESLALRQALGDTRLCANSLFHLGELALSSGDRDVAIERYEEGLALARTIGDTWGTSLALAELAGLHVLAGAYARAETLGTEALALARARGGRRVLLSCLQQVGALLVARGNAAAGVRLWGLAEAQLREISSSSSRLEELIAAQFGPAARTTLGVDSVRGRADGGYRTGAGRGGRARDGRRRVVSAGMADVVRTEALRVTGTALAGRIIPLRDELLIGRSAPGDGTLGDDPALSRRHARIVRTASGAITLVDMGSSNGSWVNGERVVTRDLEVGDRIEVGGTTLELITTELEQQAPRAPETPTDPESFRAEFPVFQRFRYLNGGTDGPVPARAAAAAQAQISFEAENGRSGAEHWSNLFALWSTLRSRYARVLGCGPTEVALTRATTDGVNTVLAGFPLGPGDEILTSDEEHQGLHAPLAAIRARRGCAIRVVPFDEVANEVGPQTRLVACSHVSWITGKVVDVEALKGDRRPGSPRRRPGPRCDPCRREGAGLRLLRRARAKVALRPGPDRLPLRPRRADRGDFSAAVAQLHRARRHEPAARPDRPSGRPPLRPRSPARHACALGARRTRRARGGGASRGSRAAAPPCRRNSRACSRNEASPSPIAARRRSSPSRWTTRRHSWSARKPRA